MKITFYIVQETFKQERVNSVNSVKSIIYFL